ncbi:MAG TPA: hypothetical protein VG738_14570 [Chitinophagaceae bacterium]|nr:hypothetical protein [Chitinophagaceae bacterium]
MEFEDLQKIWIAESQQSVYVINEKALHNNIMAKRKSALRITNAREILLIAVNFSAGCFIFIINFRGGTTNLFMLIMAAWLLLTSVYVLISHRRRLHQQTQFDCSMRDDLRHAVATATYQVWLSQIMRFNILPIASLCMAGLLEAGKPAWAAIGVTALFIIAFYIGGWEHRFYKSRKKNLEPLQTKLEQ